MPYNVADTGRGNGNRGRGQANPEFVGMNKRYLELTNQKDRLTRIIQKVPFESTLYTDMRAELTAMEEEMAELRPLLAATPRAYT